MEIISRMQELWLFDFYYVKLQTQHNLKNLNLNRTETYNFKMWFINCATYYFGSKEAFL